MRIPGSQLQLPGSKVGFWPGGKSQSQMIPSTWTDFGFSNQEQNKLEKEEWEVLQCFTPLLPSRCFVWVLFFLLQAELRFEIPPTLGNSKSIFHLSAHPFCMAEEKGFWKAFCIVRSRLESSLWSGLRREKCLHPQNSV